MKLQRNETNRLGKIYVKYQVVIPNNIVEQAGWVPKDNMEFQLDRRRRVIMAVCNSPDIKSAKISYDEIRNEVTQVLGSVPEGLTWSEMRQIAPHLPLKPSAIWVRRMEADLGLIRMTEARTHRKIWKIQSLSLPARLSGNNDKTTGDGS